MSTSVKIVSDGEPNEDGVWITVDVDISPCGSFAVAAAFLERHMNRIGFHVVQIASSDGLPS